MAEKKLVWLEDRCTALFPLLQPLTVAEEDEIRRLCDEEKAYFRSRVKSESSLKMPMTLIRNKIREWPLTEATCWINPRTGKEEHIVLKHMNWSDDEYSVINAPSVKVQQEREEDVKPINDPDVVVDKAVELLHSRHWYEIATGLAVLTGRRVTEILEAGEFFPKSPYSVLFSGQLKRRDKVLPPYEVPTNAEASLVLDAWRRLRDLLGGSLPDDRLCSEAAEKHFAALVPGRSGGDLYTHLCRSVYGQIAVFYYAPPEVLALRYLATIYGHYWVLESTGERQHNYLTTLHYADYQIGDAAIAAHHGKRQGVKLGAPGVEVLDVFRRKDQGMTTTAGKSRKAVETDEATELTTTKASQTGFSSCRPKQDTKLRLEQIGREVGARIDDDYLRILCDEHYELKTLKDQGVNLEALISLLVDAKREDSDPVSYLNGLLEQKRTFKQSYEKRHQGKDYSTMSMSDLRNTKTTEAAYERFSRAIDAIMAYNYAAASPDARWYINAKVVTDLVGGKPAIADAYLKQPEVKEQVDAHHTQLNITAAYNRRPVKIDARLRVPGHPGSVAFEAL